MNGLQALGYSTLALAFLVTMGCGRVGYESDGTYEQHCTTLAPLHDDFVSGELAKKWMLELSNDATGTVGGGALELSLSALSNSQALLRSRSYYDLRDNALTMQIRRPSDTQAAAFMRLGSRDGSAAEIRLANSSFSFEIDNQPAGELVYDAQRDKYWRIREAAGSLYFETGVSPDKLAIRSQTISLGAFDPSDVTVVFGLQNPNGVQAGSRVSILGVNNDVPESSHCSTDTLIESFEGQQPLLRLRERNTDSECDYQASNGTLTLSTYRVVCSIGTGRGYSLIQSEIELALQPNTDVARGIVSLRLTRDEENYLAVSANNESVWTEFLQDGVYRKTPDVPANGLTAIRIRNQDGQIYWEANTGTSTQSLERQPLPFPVDRLEVEILVSGNSGEATVRGINSN